MDFGIRGTGTRPAARGSRHGQPARACARQRAERAARTGREQRAVASSAALSRRAA